MLTFGLSHLGLPVGRRGTKGLWKGRRGRSREGRGIKATKTDDKNGSPRRRHRDVSYVRGGASEQRPARVSDDVSLLWLHLALNIPGIGRRLSRL